ncbi:hypothetical protein ACGFZL_15145 [Streptomyces sp. NPDC048182]|uniref:hypothetical protein n=1 Tax=Streptomyces sp. NPDC048182 TaxID=3365507 RepID=UPI003711F622
MGIESDQVVYEYLSRVGDVAHQRQLPSATRMRLVAGLRQEIDRHRADGSADTPAGVRRILDSLGTPADVVEAAGGGASPQAAPVPAPPAEEPRTATGRRGPRRPAPPAREEDPDDDPATAPRRRGLRRTVPRPRSAAGPATEPSPPHLADADELGTGASGAQPDWWRVERGPLGSVDHVPGFVGGVEIPDLLRPPRPPEEAAPAKPDPVPVVEVAEPRRRRLRLRRPRETTASRWTNPLLLLAAALLIAGAVIGNLVPLGLGWLIAYFSRRLTPAQSKWAVLGLPGTVAAGGAVWLWGRARGRWGDPIAEGHLNDALADTWPWTLRTAAVATALYLLWRSRTPRA